MKRCPECRRDYYDDSLRYCLEDGTVVLDGPSIGEPATAILTGEVSPHDEAIRQKLAVTGESKKSDRFWVAVLPFRYSGSDADIQELADGLLDDIVTGLSRFSYLRVIARSSTSGYSKDTRNSTEIANEIGARYVIAGSLRRVAATLRLNVQLIDVTTTANLWAETFNRSFTREAIFEIQDDLVPRIVSTVSDQYGALVNSMSAERREKRSDDYSPHEAVLRPFGYLGRLTPEEHAEVRDILETAIGRAPHDHSDCLAQLSVIYRHEYAHEYNLRPDPLGRALASARRAVAAEPTNHLAHYALATALYFQKDFLAFRPAAERALELNTMDASTMAFLGLLISYSGDWKYGLRLVKRARNLNPHHAGWYHFPAFYYAYHKRDYREALEAALKVNMPGYFFMHAASAAAYAQLGEEERAGAALQELLGLIPDFGMIAREEYGKWMPM